MRAPCSRSLRARKNILLATGWMRVFTTLGSASVERLGSEVCTNLAICGCTSLFLCRRDISWCARAVGVLGAGVPTAKHLPIPTIFHILVGVHSPDHHFTLAHWATSTFTERFPEAQSARASPTPLVRTKHQIPLIPLPIGYAAIREESAPPHRGAGMVHRPVVGSGSGPDRQGELGNAMGANELVRCAQSHGISQLGCHMERHEGSWCPRARNHVQDLPNQVFFANWQNTHLQNVRCPFCRDALHLYVSGGPERKLLLGGGYKMRGPPKNPWVQPMKDIRR